MSDIQTETQAPPPAQDPPAPAATDDDSELEARVTALEQRVTTLETTGTASSTTTLAASPGIPAAQKPTFDLDARVKELQEQGLSEVDAQQQADYEYRTWADNHPGA